MAEKENRSLNGILLFLAVCQVAPIFYTVIFSLLNREISQTSLVAASISGGSFALIISMHKLLTRRKAW
jgi:hypothetical protein